VSDDRHYEVILIDWSLGCDDFVGSDDVDYPLGGKSDAGQIWADAPHRAGRLAPEMPSLTAIANALRVGDHLIERLG
jgi:hypothetical protein